MGDEAADVRAALAALGLPERTGAEAATVMGAGTDYLDRLAHHQANSDDGDAAD